VKETNSILKRTYTGARPRCYLESREAANVVPRDVFDVYACAARLLLKSLAVGGPFGVSLHLHALDDISPDAGTRCFRLRCSRNPLIQASDSTAGLDERTRTVANATCTSELSNSEQEH